MNSYDQRGRVVVLRWANGALHCNVAWLLFAVRSQIAVQIWSCCVGHDREEIDSVASDFCDDHATETGPEDSTVVQGCSVRVNNVPQNVVCIGDTCRELSFEYTATRAAHQPE
jgi:hypothetical protein